MVLERGDNELEGKQESSVYQSVVDSEASCLYDARATMSFPFPFPLCVFSSWVFKISWFEIGVCAPVAEHYRIVL